MTIALSRAAPQVGRPEPSRSEAHLVLGMPQLGLHGLSETWLLKELGHRHWMLLAERAGRPVPEFKDAAGDTVYAAFCASSIQDASLSGFREHDRLLVSSEIARVSRTQFASTHRLSRGGTPMGRIALSSVFVKRRSPGENRSIARVAVEGFPETGAAGSARITDLASRMRADAWTEHFGFSREDAGTLGRVVFHPCPSQDFNGAGFLYFPSFQSFTDRAEWAVFGEALPRLATVARDVIYHANIEVGERLAVQVLATRTSPARFAHWCRICRDPDGARLADVFTERELLVP